MSVMTNSMSFLGYKAIFPIKYKLYTYKITPAFHRKFCCTPFLSFLSTISILIIKGKISKESRVIDVSV